MFGNRDLKKKEQKQNERISRLEKAIQEICPHKRLEERSIDKNPYSACCGVEWLECLNCRKVFYFTQKPKGSKVKTVMYI
jgi:hypothetical protein